jgi:RNA polymerase sigma-70 factor (ECF subfamily)
VSWSVITHAASGDRTAQERFAATYLAVVREFLEIRWQGTPLAGEVDDAAQDVFVECLREQGVLARADPTRGDLRGLLYGVACNVARRFEEGQGRRSAQAALSESALEHLPSREVSLSVHFDRGWARMMVRLAGERMRAEAERGRPGARLRVELLELRYSANLSIRDIARQWDVDPDVVHRAYRKARDEFRAFLRRVLAEHSPQAHEVREEHVARLLELLG